MLRKHVLAGALGVAALVGSATGAGATPSATANRLAGANRYDTAQAVARATFTSSTVALLASGTSFADALAANYISGASRAPLLLTEPTKLSAGVLPTLQDLGVTGVIVVGGTSAVSADVVRELEANGLTVSRAAGADRYATARQIAEILPKEAVGTFQGGRAAIVVTGGSFADALTAGPVSGSVAGAKGFPVLLTTPENLHEQARAALTSLEITRVIIVGGTDAVSDAAVAEMGAMGIQVRRIAGASRQATAAAVADFAKAELGMPMDRVLLARGDGFADALTGGARGSEVLAPILLTVSPTELGADAQEAIARSSATITAVDVLGGTAAIDDAVAQEAVSAARG